MWTTEKLSNLSAYCSPILVRSGENRLVFTMVRDLFVCVNANNGDVLWTIPHKTRNDIAAITPVWCGFDRVYFTSHGTGGTMIRYQDHGSKYTELWTSQALACLHGGIVFHEDSEIGQRLYGSDEKGYWVSQDVSTGEVIFQEKILNAKGSVTYADGMLYCYSEKGSLGLVKPLKEDLKLISSFPITLGTHEHWAYPVICNGKLYIRHGDTLILFDVEKK